MNVKGAIEDILVFIFIMGAAFLIIKYVEGVDPLSLGSYINIKYSIQYAKIGNYSSPCCMSGASQSTSGDSEQ